MDGGMDDLLATHFAHLFIRDPIVIFNEDLKELDADGANHFENIQSSNWQHMRFKPPPPGSDIGWRVEFRSMEIQITDFENAAFSIFIVLVTRAILSFDLNFYVPIARTTENMETAHTRGRCQHLQVLVPERPLPSTHTLASHKRHYLQLKHPSTISTLHTRLSATRLQRIHPNDHLRNHQWSQQSLRKLLPRPDTPRRIIPQQHQHLRYHPL